MNQMSNKITIYRGSHQIGGCVTEIKTGEHRIIIDMGANLPGSKVDNVMSDEELLNTVFNDKPCDGVLFTHYHGDHTGLYKKIPQDIPLYIGSTAKKILEILTEKLDSIPGTVDKGLPRIQKMNSYIPAQRIESFGDIVVTPFIVDHSALDAYMLLIEAAGKKILFTGDFRDHGIIGERNTLEKTIKEYIGEIDILITEGTMLSRIDEAKWNPIQTEEDLGRRAKELFKANKESVILVSSTNLDSIMEFYHALPHEMGFVCDAYQAKLMLAAMEDKRKYYKKYRPEMIDGAPRPIYIVGDMEGLGVKQNCQEADFSSLKKTGFTMLARENNWRFAKIMKKFPDPLIIYSKWTGYLEGEHADSTLIDFIGNHRMEKLHTSGHAYVETIEKLIRLTNPKVIIPMHTECADSFSSIETFVKYQNRVKVLEDGEGYYF
ncbi:MAG: MBL fold metallo-hydrolase [Ruminococcus flavefaciens]|nr:MBL fold metallo-hydrolase [Ruminococcus flavefaciens]